MTVWKYPLCGIDSIAVSMPAGAKVLAFHLQHGQPTIWALVDPSRPTETRRFRLVGTGESLSLPGDETTYSSRLRPTYVGTAHVDRPVLVFHLFEMCDE